MEIDKNFQKLLSRREDKKPSDDLEDRIMFQLKGMAKEERPTSNYLSLAWMFLFIGFVSIIVISLVGTKSNGLFFSFNPLEFKSLIQMVCVTAILLLFENLYRKHLELKNNDQGS